MIVADAQHYAIGPAALVLPVAAADGLQSAPALYRALAEGGAGIAAQAVTGANNSATDLKTRSSD